MGIIVAALPNEDVNRLPEIDRAEHVQRLYRYHDGVLVPEPYDFYVRGWPAGTFEQGLPLMAAELEQGGTLFGALDGERLVGAALLGGRFRGPNRDQLQLVFMHVGNGYRRQGIGSRLMAEAVDLARRRGARYLYISATPSDSAIGFYTGYGARPALQVDKELFALEPEDIHLVLEL